MALRQQNIKRSYQDLLTRYSHTWEVQHTLLPVVFLHQSKQMQQSASVCREEDLQ